MDCAGQRVVSEGAGAERKGTRGELLVFKYAVHRGEWKLSKDLLPPKKDFLVGAITSRQTSLTKPTIWYTKFGSHQAKNHQIMTEELRPHKNWRPPAWIEIRYCYGMQIVTIGHFSRRNDKLKCSWGGSRPASSHSLMAAAVDQIEKCLPYHASIICENIMEDSQDQSDTIGAVSGQVGRASDWCGQVKPRKTRPSALNLGILAENTLRFYNVAYGMSRTMDNDLGK
ncbi:hypothetical protein DL93DRAFT_2160988 [Clavulina sp. PMI_390]|nr:hypothetical protein DL93DRAFT_2160988 [Clavulina sp. PMI_390]